jgi:hypothetical protein
MFSRSRHRLAGLLLSGLSLTACSNAGDNLGFGPPGSGRVTATFLFDRDASGDATTPDTTFTGLRLNLVAVGSSDTVATALSDSTGNVVFTDIPVGAYRIEVGPAGLGDSLVPTKVTPATANVTVAGAEPHFSVVITYPASTVAQVRGLSAGSRVRVAAVVLSGAQEFTDTTAYIRDSTGPIRLLSALHFDGTLSNAPGDSVQVIGVVNTRNGQPVIDLARLTNFFDVGTTPAPAADTLTAVVARLAEGGARDADLVFLNTATIVSSTAVGSALQVTVDDGTAQIDLLIDAALTPSASTFPNGGSIRTFGVLVPTGAGVWQLKPRTTTDYTVF